MPSPLPTTDDLAHCFSEIETAISDACRRASRSRHEVTLIAVTKGHDFSKLAAAYHLGQRDFGESYAHEMASKIKLAQTANLKDIKWHFMGAIQTNKLKLIRKADFVHSIGSVRHAELLNDMADKVIDIFLQVNLDGDVKRQGFLCADLLPAVKKVAGFKRLRLKGLMAILPQDPDSPMRVWFTKMVDLKRTILKSGLLEEVYLSMGMSDDFAEAIMHGTNFVRIGTKLFGPRQ